MRFQIVFALVTIITGIVNAAPVPVTKTHHAATAVAKTATKTQQAHKPTHSAKHRKQKEEEEEEDDEDEEEDNSQVVAAPAPDYSGDLKKALAKVGIFVASGTVTAIIFYQIVKYFRTRSLKAELDYNLSDAILIEDFREITTKYAQLAEDAKTLEPAQRAERLKNLEVSSNSEVEAAIERSRDRFKAGITVHVDDQDDTTPTETNDGETSSTNAKHREVEPVHEETLDSSAEHGYTSSEYEESEANSPSHHDTAHASNSHQETAAVAHQEEVSPQAVSSPAEAAEVSEPGSQPQSPHLSEASQPQTPQAAAQHPDSPQTPKVAVDAHSSPSPKVDTPKAESPKAETPKAETPKVAVSSTDGTTVAAPEQNTAKLDSSKLSTSEEKAAVAKIDTSAAGSGGVAGVFEQSHSAAKSGPPTVVRPDTPALAAPIEEAKVAAPRLAPVGQLTGTKPQAQFMDRPMTAVEIKELAVSQLQVILTNPNAEESRALLEAAGIRSQYAMPPKVQKGGKARIQVHQQRLPKVPISRQDSTTRPTYQVDTPQEGRRPISPQLSPADSVSSESSVDSEVDNQVYGFNVDMDSTSPSEGPYTPISPGYSETSDEVIGHSLDLEKGGLLDLSDMPTTEELFSNGNGVLQEDAEAAGSAVFREVDAAIGGFARKTAVGLGAAENALARII